MLNVDGLAALWGPGGRALQEELWSSLSVCFGTFNNSVIVVVVVITTTAVPMIIIMVRPVLSNPPKKYKQALAYVVFLLMFRTPPVSTAEKWLPLTPLTPICL